VRTSFPAQARREAQEGELWEPHQAAQADAEATSARLSSTEVMKVRRTRSILKTCPAAEGYLRVWDRWVVQPFPFLVFASNFLDAPSSIKGDVNIQI
jgi:hypothetical protein